MAWLTSLIALVLVATTMGLSLAHALEFPGKLRLDEPAYRAVQAIYYPGFSYGGLVGEFGGMVALGVLLMLTEATGNRFWLVVASLSLLLAGHLVYWVVTHPVNKEWLAGTQLDRASSFFFGLFSVRHGDWRQLRDAWEWSHVARAALAATSFILLASSLLC